MVDSKLAAEFNGLPQRSADSHKGDYGKLLLLGGSCSMPGAIALAAMASLRSGAGLVTVATAATVHSIVAGFDPCVMTIPLCCSANGTIDEDADSLSKVVGSLEQYDAIAIGPGLGKSAELSSLVSELYEKVRGPLIIDADGLNLLASNSGGLPVPSGPRVLTPHVGEFGRLLQYNPHGLGVEGILTRADLEQAAVELAGKSQTVIALKGNTTFVTDGSMKWHNKTGNAGMATAGSGDVLTGVIAALIGQGMDVCDAVRLGVQVHGCAGDLAAAKLGMVSMTALDIIDFLSTAFQQ
ncbi:MAG: NAD(P)H-hydrate dehydratase [Planctomycetaceae bacterium]|jgi:ADP-dependent NAD(P)H-hydrate dehydratase|nr:NAD(P)H-hydrate dehydratase [Planctomycetaceae bacterium]